LAHEVEVACELAENGGNASREWIALLLDRALEVRQQEIIGRVRRSQGPFLAQIATQPDEWA